jgi:hypothetical protein
MISDNVNPASDDGLDDAIRTALRVEVDTKQLAGLETFWRVQSQRDRWRRNVRRVAAAAAAIILVATSLLVLQRQREREITQVVEQAPGKRADPDSVKSTNKLPIQPVNPTLLPGRQPTAYEQLVFIARSGAAPRKTPTASKIDETIRHVASNAETQPAKALASLGLNDAAAESLLLRRLPGAPASDQHAILRLLAECGSQRSTTMLLRVARAESLRIDALAALERIVGIDGLPQMVGKSTDANVRSALIRRLLTADSQPALVDFLSLVGDESTRAEAISVAKDAPNVPVPQLVTMLDDVDEPIRVAAAITLGHINGPETTRLLINRVTEQPAHSKEAWLALIACRGKMARDFLDYATRRPQLLGHYNYARLRWAQMIQ